MDLVEIKTRELIGPALDWVVLAAMEVNGNQSYWKSQMLERPQSYTFRPSTDWSQGGPLIEQYQIDTVFDPNGTAVVMGRLWVNQHMHNAFGLTLLIAAMRCLVASKLGDTMQVPAALIQ